MSKKVCILRSLVNERLTAAAEEIFALVERTIVEYEEELCRSKEENQRKQQLLDSVLNPHTTQDIQTDFTPEPSVKQEIILQTTKIKEEPEEQRFKQEEEQLPEFTAVCLKSEEQSSLLQQRQSEHRELTQGEHCGGAGADISLDPRGHLHSETDNDEDWEPAASSSTAQMETEADGDHYNQVQIKDTSTDEHNSDLFNIYKCGAESRATVTEGHVSETEGGNNNHECTFCQKRCKTKQSLEIHIRTHTGEKPYSCSICKKSFSQTQHLKIHLRVHSRERTYRCLSKGGGKRDKRNECSVCKKTYTTKQSLEIHMRTHTGERPFSCSICQKTFTRQTYLDYHVRVHTGEKPYSCSICMKTFSQKSNFNEHIKTHTGRGRSKKTRGASMFSPHIRGRRPGKCGPNMEFPAFW